MSMEEVYWIFASLIVGVLGYAAYIVWKDQHDDTWLK